MEYQKVGIGFVFTDLLWNLNLHNSKQRHGSMGSKLVIKMPRRKCLCKYSWGNNLIMITDIFEVRECFITCRLVVSELR